jgi:hypothetical protein
MCKPRPEFCLTEYGKSEVQKHIRLAYVMANKYRTPYRWEHDDWVSECMEVLCLAVARFSPARNASLYKFMDKLVWLRRSNINSSGRSLRSGRRSATLSIDGPNLGNLCTYTDNGLQHVERVDFVLTVLKACSYHGSTILVRIADGVPLPEIGAGIGFSYQRINRALFRERAKLIKRFPEEVRGSGSCKQCGGVLAVHSSKSKPIYCNPCSVDRVRAVKRRFANKGGE